MEPIKLTLQRRASRMIVQRKLHGDSGLRVRKRSGQIMNFVDHDESVIERVDRTSCVSLSNPTLVRPL
jgi:hypothetical protein